MSIAWKRVLDPATGLRNASLLYDVKGARAFHEGRARDPGVRALDDATLVVELEGPTGYFLHLVSVGVTYPVPRHVVEHHGCTSADNQGLITNGPFAVVSWERGESLVLDSYPHYHGRFLAM